MIYNLLEVESTNCWAALLAWRANQNKSPTMDTRTAELDVLWCQPIKLIHVVSTSEFHEYWWNDIDFIFFIPSIFCSASEDSNIDSFKN